MRRLFLALAVGWMLFIFYQGTRTWKVSMEKSNEIVEQIIEIIEKPKSSTSEIISTSEEHSAQSATKEEQPATNKLQTTLSYWIRKGAHFFEYLILAMLLFRLLTFYPVSIMNRIIYSLFIVMLCAVLDEYLQSFVQRTSSVSDVLIDLGGGLIGISIIRGILYLKNKVFTSKVT